MGLITSASDITDSLLRTCKFDADAYWKSHPVLRVAIETQHGRFLYEHFCGVSAGICVFSMFGDKKKCARRHGGIGNANRGYLQFV